MMVTEVPERLLYPADAPEEFDLVARFGDLLRGCGEASVQLLLWRSWP